MEDEKTVLEFDPRDLLSHTIEQLVCTDCIKGHCPSRTPATCAGEDFTFCSARKIAQPVLAAYTDRIGRELHRECPCAHDELPGA